MFRKMLTQSWVLPLLLLIWYVQLQDPNLLPFVPPWAAYLGLSLSVASGIVWYTMTAYASTLHDSPLKRLLTAAGTIFMVSILLCPPISGIVFSTYPGDTGALFGKVTHVLILVIGLLYILLVAVTLWRYCQWRAARKSEITGCPRSYPQDLQTGLQAGPAEE